MGQTLSEPIVTKNTASCSNSRYNIGSSSMQGWRISMEDAHIHLLEMPIDHTAAFFAVFDGHGGARIAKYASQYLHKEIEETDAYADGRISDALIDGFLSLDVQMRENAELKEEMSGSTAVAVLIKNNCIYCANAGDSRAVASIAGRAVPLSNDHKPSNEEESRRIFAAGGWVEFNRVNGNLALSRALGDFAFKNNESMSAKEQIVTACPDVETHAITADHEFVILACDGIWDVMSNQEVVDFCRGNLINGLTPDRICEELLNKCLAPDCELSGLGCDNMSCILVCLSQDRSPEEYLKQLQNATVVRSEADRPNLQNTQIGGTQSEFGNTDENEAGEEIFLTPSHSPPINAINEYGKGIPVVQTETSDADMPPNQFKVQQEILGKEHEMENTKDDERASSERQEPEDDQSPKANQIKSQLPH